MLAGMELQPVRQQESIIKFDIAKWYAWALCHAGFVFGLMALMTAADSSRITPWHVLAVVVVFWGGALMVLTIQRMTRGT